MGILSGIISYLMGFFVNVIDSAITAVFGVFNFSMVDFESYFPAAAVYFDVIMGFGFALLMIMFIFQVFKNFGGVLDIESEDPLKLLGKTTLFLGMIISSRSICNFIIDFLTEPFAIFLSTYEHEFEFSLVGFLDNIISGFTTPSFMSIIYVIMTLIIGWQFLKFLLEVIERYIVFHFVLYCAPVVFATGPFKSTNQIFKSWCRMVMSQGILLLVNIWSAKLFVSFLGEFIPNGEADFLLFFLGYAFLKFAQKADTLLRILGLNTASTGGMASSIGNTISGIAQAIQRTGRAAGGAMGGKGKNVSGSSSNTNSEKGSTSSGDSGVGRMSKADGASQAGSTSTGLASNINDDIGKAAKQQYKNDVLSSAKEQMGSGGDSGSDSGTNNSQSNSIDEKQSVSNMTKSPTSMPNKGASSTGSSPQSSLADTDKKQNALAKKMKATQTGNNKNIDMDTKEGLANLAHGLPHDQHNESTKQFEGGGFSEYTGEEANVIGSSVLSPADGVSQSNVKMADGLHGSLYTDSNSGESNLVQFASVDNGVLQGTITPIDSNTGVQGDHMAFKAVHESVPNAASFSKHSTAISDSQGGAYYISSGASTSFFAPASASKMAPSPSTGIASASGNVNSSSTLESGASTATATHPSPSIPLGKDGATAATTSSSTTPATTSTVESGIGSPNSQNSSGSSLGNISNSTTPRILASSDTAGANNVTSSVSSQNMVSNGSSGNQSLQGDKSNDVRRFSKDNPLYKNVFSSSNQVQVYQKPSESTPIKNIKRNDTNDKK